MKSSQSKKALELHNVVGSMRSPMAASELSPKFPETRKRTIPKKVGYHPSSKRRRDLSMGILCTLANSSHSASHRGSQSPPQSIPHYASLKPFCFVSSKSQSILGDTSKTDSVEEGSDITSLRFKEPQTVQLKPHHSSSPGLVSNKAQETKSTSSNPHNCYDSEPCDPSASQGKRRLQPIRDAIENAQTDNCDSDKKHFSTPVEFDLIEAKTLISIHRRHQDTSPGLDLRKACSESDLSRLNIAAERNSLPCTPKMTARVTTLFEQEPSFNPFKAINRGNSPRVRSRRSPLQTKTNSEINPSATPSVVRQGTPSDPLSSSKGRKEALKPEKFDSRPIPNQGVNAAITAKSSAKLELGKTTGKKQKLSPTPLRSRRRTSSLIGRKRIGSLHYTIGKKTKTRLMPIQIGGGGVFTTPQSSSENEIVKNHRTDDQKQEPEPQPTTKTSPLQSTTRSKNESRSSASSERHSQRILRRGSARLMQTRRLDEVIVIDSSDEDDNKNDAKEQFEEQDECAAAICSLASLSLQNQKQSLKELPVCPFLNPLSEEEETQVLKIYRQKDQKEIKYIPSARIVLRGEDFKRLRGVRWLNDEVINAYMSLINERNDSIFAELTCTERSDIPHTYVFNTFFYTRLTSGPERYDFTGVRKWTMSGKIDVTKKDLLLFPVNLGNHHWVLAGIDRPRRSFFYLDSMAGPDKGGVLETLRRWYHDELEDKFGKHVTDEMDLGNWSFARNRYMIRRVGVLPTSLESGVHSPRLARIPVQTDGGSCGVFIAKMADCLSLGIKIYFNQRDIPLVRRRMVLDLLRGQLAM